MSWVDDVAVNDVPFLLADAGGVRGQVLIKLSTQTELQAKPIQALVPQENRLGIGEALGANIYNELEGVLIAADDVNGVAAIQEWSQNGGGVFHQLKVDGVWWRVKRVSAYNIGGLHALILDDGGQQNH